MSLTTADPQTQATATAGGVGRQALAGRVCVQYGCGLCAPQGWLNFDVSPMLRLQRLPLVGRWMPAGPFGRFPLNVRYGDIIKGLPVAPASVDLAYCSHTLEHLSLADFRAALRNTFAMLKPGGVFRFVLPDLRALAQESVRSSDPAAATRFVGQLLMGDEHRARGMRAMLKETIGNTRHRWMWDEPALVMELKQAGFVDVRRAQRGDSGDALFEALEDPDRWDNYAVGMQARRPA